MNGGRATRVVLADDTVLLREGVARLLQAGGLDVVGQAGDGAALLSLVDELQPDVAVVDIRMPPTRTTEGLEAAVTIRARHPQVGVLILSDHVEPRYAIDLLARDGRGIGYLLKDRVMDTAEFLRAVRDVAAGASVVDAGLVRRLVSRQRVDAALDRLTERERDVLELMASGRSNAGICAELTVSSKTVETYVSRIFTKLGLEVATDDNRRVLAILRFLRF